MEPIPRSKAILLAVGLLCGAMAVGCQNEVDRPANTAKNSPAATPAPAATPDADAVPAANAPNAAEEPNPETTEPIDTESAEPIGTQQPGHEGNPEPEGESNEEAKVPLPEPLVDAPESLVQLHPKYPVWIDADRTRVILVGRVCQRRVPLELFACARGGKTHESIVQVDTEAYVLHVALLTTGVEPGGPVEFDPEFVPAHGPETEVTVVWNDPSGRRRQCRAQHWIRNVANIYRMFEGVVANEFDEELNLEDQWEMSDEMQLPWVFAGSQFHKDEQTGDSYYVANAEGDLICVSNFPSAILDVPVRSSDSNAALLFEAFTERIPPLDTPVTLILTPKKEPQPDPKPTKPEPTSQPTESTD